MAMPPSIAVTVTAGGQRSTNALLFSYDPPVIDSVSPNVADAEGGQVLTIAGKNLGRSVK